MSSLFKVVQALERGGLSEREAIRWLLTPALVDPTRNECAMDLMFMGEGERVYNSALRKAGLEVVASR